MDALYSGDFLTCFYTCSGFLSALAFTFQIIPLVRNLDSARSMSISSWGVFTLCSVAAFLYALNNNGDLYFIATSFICLSGNVVILTLAILAQVKYRIQLRSMQPVTQII